MTARLVRTAAHRRSLADELMVALDAQALSFQAFMRPHEHEFVYDGPAGFVLEHGSGWCGRPELPAGVMAGAPKMCFGNAIMAGVLEGLRYVEGFAMHRFSSGLAIHHAWNVDNDGRVIDTTWAPFARERGLGDVAYLGVEFSLERADDATWNGDATVLDDPARKHPLLRERWQGEPPDRVWPSSARLTGLRLLAAGDVRRGYALLQEGTAQ